MTKPYFTLCIYDPEYSAWFDSFGDYDKGEVEGERDTERDNGHPAKCLKIIKTDGTFLDLINKRDALRHP